MKPAKESKTVKVKILDKEVQIGCAPGDEDALSRAAQLVDQAMREFRNRNSTASAEKIAIITAINMSNEYLRAKGSSNTEETIAKKVDEMQAKVSAMLQEE